MKKILFSLLLVIGMTVIVNAQDYKTGLGLRGGSGWGLTVKHFVSQKSAFEGLLYRYNDGFIVTGLYELHYNAFDVDNLNWYFGFGAHVGTYTHGDLTEESDFVLGADGILGIEYSFSEAPINIGVDWNPYFNVLGDTHPNPNFGSGAISIRYIF